MQQVAGYPERLRPLENAPDGFLKIHEIYLSVQGESTYAGVPCVFVRTTACHLRCSYCDTRHAFTQGAWMSYEDVLSKVRGYAVPCVEFTGGEPLLQEGVLGLMSVLCDDGKKVLLETSGSLDISRVDPRVVRIVDFKAPSSREEPSNAYANIALLRPHDEVKLVLGHREDYLWAKQLIEKHALHTRCTVLMGVVWGALQPQELVQWILEDALPVRLNVQMHKYVWDPKTRGV
jgi:7-carboxy-7-deazaguanine synthase